MPSANMISSVVDAGPALADAVQRHLEAAFRVMLKGPRATTNDQFVRVVTGAPHPFGNFTVVRSPTDADALAAAIAPLKGLPAPAAALFPCEVPSAAHEALERADFHPHAPMPGMAVDIDALTATPPPSGCSLVRVGAGEAGDLWARTFISGYELPEVLAEVFSPTIMGVGMAPDEAAQFFLVMRDGRPVGTSMCFLHDGLAGIYCVATIPNERRNGIGAFATTEPLRLARRLGYRVGVLQSSEPGYPVYRRLGFSDHGSIPLYVRMPS